MPYFRLMPLLFRRKFGLRRCVGRRRVVEVEIPNKKKRSQGEGCAATLLRLAYKNLLP